MALGVPEGHSKQLGGLGKLYATFHGHIMAHIVAFVKD
jgi:hypothetical protein